MPLQHPPPPICFNKFVEKLRFIQQFDDADRAGRCRAADGRANVLMVVAIAAALLLTSSALAAGAGVLESRLAEAKQQKVQIGKELDYRDTQEEILSTKIADFTRKVAKLDAPIGELNEQIAYFEAQILERKRRIEELRRQYTQQQELIKRLEVELELSQDRFTDRLVEIYQSGTPEYGEWLLKARTINDLVERERMAGQIAEYDNKIMQQIDELQRSVRLKRARNRTIQDDVRNQLAGVQEDQEKVEAAKAKLVTQQQQLAAAKAERAAFLGKVRKRQDALQSELDNLDEQSAALAEAIKNGNQNYGASVPGGPSPAGLIWPVSGPVVSPFGPRWGRMHEGIDIAVPTGTPIRAAAGGVVTHAGWMSGYGNLVILQHAGGLSTSYAHQSQIGSSVGQFVPQGQVLGYVGCTGHCYGDHLHFETRVNGAAVDPMNYL